MKDEKICAECKWMNQGENSAKCFNPHQKEKAYKEYVYWCYSCTQFEQGKQKPKQEMERMGYKQKVKELKLASGEISKYNYYTK